ncbi:EAL domain-containing protein [Shewanella algae]|uniref:EAL domain-containing protein n=1 Tax=Shewanella algae TaxID=38313 RepID=UPI000B8AB250|nr:EAL domain-containing protein [Shewanella algae]OXS00039.1 diguanylate cyclase [Shewanella algae]
MPNLLLRLILLWSLVIAFIPAKVSALPLIDTPAPILLKAETYGVPEGLSQSTVTSITEDSDGYIWIGTLNGLNRFDGKEFKQYFANDGSGLKSSFIQSLYFHKDLLLVGTNNGLYTYNKEKNTFISVSGINGAVWSLQGMGDSILVGLNDKIAKVEQITTATPKITLLQSESFLNVKQVIVNNNSYIIRNHDGSVYHTDEDTSKTELISKESTSISQDGEYVYILKEDGIYRWKNEELKNISIGSYNSIFNLNNDLYALKNNKVFNILSNGDEKRLGQVDGIDLSTSMSFVYAEKGRLYIPFLNKGFSAIDIESQLASTLTSNTQSVWHIQKNQQNNILVSDDTQILTLLDENLDVIFSIDSGIKGPKTAGLVKDTIFYGSLDGLYAINVSTETRYQVVASPIVAFAVNKDETRIAVSTADSLILEVDIKTLTVVSQHDLSSKPAIFNMAYENNELYVATQAGVFIVSSAGVRHIFEEELTYSIAPIDSGIYIGTGTGLKFYDKTTQSITTKFITNSPIYSIATDSDGNYVATSIRKILIGIAGRTYVLNEDFGSQYEYNTQSASTWRNGFLLGGISGLTIISPNDIVNFKNSHKPKANLNELLIFNIPQIVDNSKLSAALSLSKEIKLKYSDYPFTLRFNSPKYSHIKLEYEYRLQGLSDDWISSKGINSATYTNLSPGSYTFQVRAIDPITGEKGQDTELQVNITPPWWLSTLAKTLYVLAILLILTAITKAVLRKREIQRQIALSEERLKLSLWGSGDEMWDWDIETGQIYRSNIWGSLEFPRDGQRSGHHGEESNIHPQDRERVREALNKHFYGETDHFEATYRVKSKSGEWLWILDRAKIVERDEHDNALRMTGTIKNINSFKTAEEQLRLFERAIENISEGMFILDADFHYVEVNEACCELTQHSRNQLLGTTLQFSRYPDNYNQQIKQLLQQYGRWSNDIEAIKGDGSEFLMELTIDAIYDEQGILTHYVGVFSDISRRKQQEEELRKLTNNDLLTGLPNRSNLQVTLGNLVKKDHHHTLMVLDLDNFKKINDSLGHQIGDELLILVAERLQQSIPGHTNLYRLGGDEFAILVDKNPDIGSSAVIASRVIDAFGQAFELVGEQLVVGVSIGIVLYPEDEQNEQALLRKADIAMYHAKSAGGNRYQFYSESLNRNAIRQLEVENLIREGLKDDLFEVYYQPKINLRSGLVSGMEALVRLNHPQHGLIPPNDFIPLAEENGLIVEIGDLVMRKACFAAQQWREQGLFDGRVAVNLSSRQFALPDLQQRIASILRLTRLPPANLELEITEGTVIKHPEKAIKVMQQLAKMGVCLALDDFGTGYSSLSYLKRFPIHSLKIDKAFVDDIDKSDRDLKMVDSIITIAHNMGLSVVGEGVEDSSQLSILKALNCEEIQGFIYSKAVPEAEFSEYLKQNLPAFTGKKNTI